MAIDLTTFRAMFPEWDSVADPTVQLWIDKSEAYLCPDNWGDCFEDAVLYRAAHQLALSQARKASVQTGGNGETVVSGGAGAVVSASVDGVSVSYATPAQATSDSNSDAWYSQTPYGQYFLTLREGCLRPVTMTGVNQPQV